MSIVTEIVNLLMQKMESVPKAASSGTEFMLEGMQASSSGEANACPLTLVFRWDPQDQTGATPVHVPG